MINRSNVFIIGSYVAGCIAQANSIPSAGETVAANSFLLQPGGKGFNLLAGLYRLGADVDGILPAGDDLWGRLSPQLLEENGLPKDWLLPMEGASGGAVGLVDGQGENRIAISAGVNGLLSARHLELFRERISGAALVSGQFEVPDEALIAAFSLAREGGATTLLNPSPFRLLDEALLKLTDIIVVNATEAFKLADQIGVTIQTDRGADGFLKLVEGLQRKGLDKVIITLGASGVVAFKRGEDGFRVPAYAVEVIDTTGAGDAFNAGLIAGLLRGLSLVDALQLATACGAMMTMGAGVLDNLPTRADVDHFIRRMAR